MTKELEPLDILLYKGKNFISWVIEVETSSAYSHVALVVDPELSLGIESNMGFQSGVKAFDLRKLSMAEVDVYRIRPDFLTKVNKEKARSFLVGHLGARYDLRGVIGLGLLKIISLITRGWTRKWNNDFQKNRDYFCSELCYAAFISAGLDIVPAVPEADVTSPGDIAKSAIIQKI